MTKLAARDQEAVESFHNFLSWGERPVQNWHLGHSPYRFCFPPAVIAYTMGLTKFCPPRGTM